MREAPTVKQLLYIESITNDLGVEFNGKTKEDATLWLSTYIPKHKEYIRDSELEYEANNSNLFSNWGDYNDD